MDMAAAHRSVPLPILLVDDFAPFRITLRQILEGYREFTVVGEAGDGHSALELALSLAPQVVIMDVQMPRLGGVEATRRLKPYVWRRIMNEELGSLALDEPVTVNHIILNGSLVVLTDGRVLNIPAKAARVTNVWSLSTRLEIWRDDPASPFPLCVRNTIKDEEVHRQWAPRPAAM